MRVLYSTAGVQYWLEPTTQEPPSGKVRLMGCKLYKLDGKFVGWWEGRDMPRDVKDMVLHAVREKSRKDAILERSALRHSRSPRR